MAIRILGLPRSCTNVVDALLTSNFKIQVISKQKHVHWSMQTEEDGLKFNFVVCTKHPYDWLWSFFNYENRCKLKTPKTIEEFLTTRPAMYRDGGWTPSFTPIKLFNYLTKRWLSVYDDPTIVQQIKYEELLKSQLIVMGRIGKAFNLKRKGKREIHFTVGAGKRVKQYLHEHRPHEFDRPWLDYINEHLDKDVVALTGYELE